MDLLPCPFCGLKPDLENGDTLYPSGFWWRETDGLRHYIRHADVEVGDKMCWSMHCADTAGGCGVEMDGDSKEEVVSKWNKRI